METKRQIEQTRLRSYADAKAIDVSASDETVSPPCNAFRVGTTAGDVAVVTLAGNTVTIEDVQKGEIVPLAVRKFLTIGTGAAGITALW